MEYLTDEEKQGLIKHFNKCFNEQKIKCENCSNTHFEIIYNNKYLVIRCTKCEIEKQLK